MNIHVNNQVFNINQENFFRGGDDGSFFVYIKNNFVFLFWKF